MARIIIEGSSTAYGLWSGGEGGWADRLKNSFLDVDDCRKSFAAVVNLATPAKTIDKSIETMDAVAQTMTTLGPTRIGIIQPGMIESRFVDGEIEMPPHVYHEAIRKFGGICVKYGFAPIFVGMTPIDESRTTDFVVKGQSFTFSERERMRYDNIVRHYCDENNYTYVDVAAGLAERYPDPEPILDRDGFHVNSLGHAALHDMILPVVVAEIERQRVAQARSASELAV